jgi:adenylate cyclase
MMAEAGDWFTEAIRREPRFANAYFLRSDLYAHRTTTDAVPDAERRTAYEQYMADLALASEYARTPAQKAMIDVDRTLASSNWGPLPAQINTALSSDQCVEPVWIEVVPPFGFAEKALDFRLREIECDPLNFYPYYSAGLSAMWAGQPELTLQLARRGETLLTGEPFLKATAVLALLALNRVEDAQGEVEGYDGWNRDVLMTSVAAAAGDMEGARAAAAQMLDSAEGWTRRFLAIELNAIAGNREMANAAAAWFDRIPAGQLMLAAATMECMCGAPFDLEATPVFAKRLEEAGFAWPPPNLIRELAASR